MRIRGDFRVTEITNPYNPAELRFIDSIRNRKKPVIFGDRTHRRGFMYVEDTVRSFVLAMKNGTPGEAYKV